MINKTNQESNTGRFPWEARQSGDGRGAGGQRGRRRPEQGRRSAGEPQRVPSRPGVTLGAGLRRQECDQGRKCAAVTERLVLGTRQPFRAAPGHPRGLLGGRLCRNRVCISTLHTGPGQLCILFFKNVGLFKKVAFLLEELGRHRPARAERDQSRPPRSLPKAPCLYVSFPLSFFRSVPVLLLFRQKGDPTACRVIYIFSLNDRWGTFSYVRKEKNHDPF